MRFSYSVMHLSQFRWALPVSHDPLIVRQWLSFAATEDRGEGTESPTEL